MHLTSEPVVTPTTPARGRRALHLLAWFPAASAAVLVAAFVVDRDSFYELTREDRLLEWAQFTLCLVAAGVAVAAARRALGGRARLAAALLVVLALGCLALAGEEISWGQRVIGAETPAAVAEMNKQAELNVHNIEAGAFSLEKLFKTAEFLLCLAAAGLALAAARVPARVPATLRLLAPPVAAVPLFATMAAYQATQFLVLKDDWDAAARMQEWAEVCMVLGLAATAAVVHLRLRGSARTIGVVTVVAVLVTVVFAVLSARSGVLPGNV